MSDVTCKFCATAPVGPLRLEFGYEHCSAKACVAMFRRERLESYALILMPKQGFAIVERSNTSALNARMAKGK